MPEGGKPVLPVGRFAVRDRFPMPVNRHHAGLPVTRGRGYTLEGLGERSVVGLGTQTVCRRAWDGAPRVRLRKG